MLCYRDMTFCKDWRSCAKGEKCERALTPQVEDAAERRGLPICRFTDRPDCWRKKEGGKR